jgi:putative DNA primase/helicase
VKHLIQQYQETGQRERRRQTRTWEHTTEQAEVADALRRIPAWGIAYDEWVSVLMALHREYGDAGFGLAEAWADGAPNEVERKWKSFHEAGNYAGAVTLGTVFALAKRFGWSRTQ